MFFRHRITYCCGDEAPRLWLVALAACGGPRGPSTPAADGVRAYLAALRSDDAARGVRAARVTTRARSVSFDEFALEWKQSAAERAWQAKALEESLKGNPDVGERALISFSDGKLVALEREGKTWRLESELVSRSRAKRRATRCACSPTRSPRAMSTARSTC